jgi:hypothetical protein
LAYETESQTDHSRPEAAPTPATLQSIYPGTDMPILFILTALFQLTLAIHVAKTGRQLYWIMIIVMLPWIGGIAYLIAEVLPGLRNDPNARRALRSIGEKINPEKNRRRIETELQVADTLENRKRLAEECVKLGDFDTAAFLYQRCLSGVYANDPGFMLGLATAQAELGKFSECRVTLEQLIAANPSFRSSEGHLLYARSLEQLGETAKALEEYVVLETSYPGEEARCRYGMLLMRDGRAADAKRVFEAMMLREKTAPSYYRKKERAWLDQARAAMKTL